METIQMPEALVLRGSGNATLLSALPAPTTELRLILDPDSRHSSSQVPLQFSVALPSSLCVTVAMAAARCWSVSVREFSPASDTEHVPKERVPQDSNVCN